MPRFENERSGSAISLFKDFINAEAILYKDIKKHVFKSPKKRSQDCHNREHYEKNSPVVKGVMFDEHG
ncbi:hypothetical protein RGU76_28070 [Bacillus pseudomycoides]|uniref:hypothetical protein n=1 Tax=Bacillus sp. DHT2 TaxID=2994532 RepID=UPI0022498F74|nr:hypothetical protein [Bacillus sp. DHT2]MDR4918696.1 hypothetical protein [Bacillus pseudomycoides]